MSNQMGGEKQFSKDLSQSIFLFLIFSFLVLFFVLANTLGETAGKVPKLITGIGIALCIIQFSNQQIKRKIKLDSDNQEEDAPPIQAESQQGLEWYKMLFLCIAYVVCLMTVGFEISSFLFLLLVPRIMGYKNWKKTVIFSLVSTLVLYYSFTVLFKVKLPQGLILPSILRW
ncbi:MAG TPA: tripartite tricarboxylate transporter TctB family protein [Desulfosporosinus sp.]|nr:tripartite tricarboxylate transporter TctB family protein [Desulfosporosinus sp.]